MGRSAEVQRQDLEQRLKELTIDLKAENERLSGTPLGAQSEQIKRSIAQIVQEMKRVEDEIESLDPSLPPRHTVPVWWAKRMYIDFKQPMQHVERRLEQLDLEGSTILILLENAETFQGELFIEQLRFYLNQSTSKFWPYAFEPAITGGVDVSIILDKLAQYLNIDTHQTLPQHYATHLREKILELLRYRHTIFIVVNYWDNIPTRQHASVLREFMQNFWLPLIQAIAVDSSAYRRSRLIVVFSCEHEFDSDCMQPDVCCADDSFSRDKALRLALQDWTLEDVLDWIERHLPIGVREAEDLAKIIYQGTHGKPASVLKRLDRFVNQHFEKGDNHA